MVLVEGQNGEGATVDEDNFTVQADDDAATVSAADQVVSAILGTREGAVEGGYQLAATGVTFTDPIEAAALRDALATHKVENVMLVSAFLAAAALAQSVGNHTNYARTALLYIEPETATLAVVNSADGSVTDVRREQLPADDEAAVAQLATMVSGAEALEARPDAVFVVGSGIDLPLIKPALEAATTLPLAAPEEPDTALARGAALASAGAPLFASSTAALAYAQDPGTGAINPFLVAPGYFETSGTLPEDALAYSAVPDDLADDPYLGEQTGATALVGTGYRDRRSFRMVGAGVAGILVAGVAALVVALAIAIRPTASVQPDPGHHVVAPTQAAPAPVAHAPAAPAPAPEANVPAPAPAPEANAPAPAPAPQAPAPAPAPEAPAPAPAPEAPAPAPEAPAPAPVPAAPPPAPAPPPVMAPIPVPIPLPIPGLGGPPVGGFGPGGGRGGGEEHGGGGFPGFPGFGGGGGHGGFGGGHGGFGRR